MDSVRAGAWFACISAVRNDLSTQSPEARERAVTIQKMTSHHCFLENSPRERVARLVSSRPSQGGQPLLELRLHGCDAQVTVCPSLGVGFEHPGVGAKASCGMAISSDVPAHREIYEDASEYVEPYATGSLEDALKLVLCDELNDERAATARARLCARRAEMAARQRT